MKSILIVTEQFTIGGLETHILGEISRLCESGIEVHLAVGKIFEDLLLPTSLASVSHSLSLDPGSTPEGLLTAINQLRKIIREHSIDGVHIHPFTSIIPAVAAAELERIPYAITLHGPASLASYGAIYDLLIKDIILPNTGLIVAVSPEVQRLLSVHATDESVICIPNAVLFSEFSDTLLSVNSIDQRWLVISRLDQFKIPGIIDFCSKAKRCEIPGVLIVGDGPAKEDLRQMLEENGLSGYATLVGVSTNVPSLIQKYAGVAGMGRVVLEGVMYRKPVVLVGYDGVKGVVDVELLAHAAKTNFSGRELSTIDAECLYMELRNKNCEANVSAVFKAAKAAFNDKDAWIHFLDQMRLLSIPKPTILTGLYHSLFDSPIVGTAPYLYSQEILDRLEAISCSINFYGPRLSAALSLCRQRIQSACPNQALAERDGQINGLNQAVAERDGQINGLNQAVAERDGQITDVNQAVAERDGQITDLNQAVAERDGQISILQQTVTKRGGQITDLNQAVAERDGKISVLEQTVTKRDGQIASFNADLYMIKQSTSWRVTSPLRVAKNLVIAPKRTTYQIFRSLFWRLPASSRQILHGPRHAFVRFFRGLPNSQALCEQNSALADISWSEFNSEILSKRDKYKSIFVQEPIIDWNVPLYQRPQHIAVALGRLGHLVIYRTNNWSNDNVDGFREVSENVWITNRYEVDEIQDVVRSIYSTGYVNTPELIMKNGKRGILIYEYIDHIDPEISGDQENIKRLLNQKKFAFEGGADFIVASANKLYDEAVDAVGKDRVILVPNGVDTVHYRSPAHKNTVVPTSLLEFKAKHNNVIGYFGALAPWLWYECIQELAVARPELGFVFIGPDYYGGAEKLPKLSNVLYLGTVDYKILPSYAQQFDICFIPFKPGDIAKTTSPLKLFEYFALEKPVVVTADMNECTAFLEVFRGGSAAELSAAIDAALLVKDQEQFKVRLRELADQNDWIQRARAMEVCFQGIK